MTTDDVDVLGNFAEANSRNVLRHMTFHCRCGRNTACNLSVCCVDNTHARAERVSFSFLQHTHTQAERLPERQCKRKRETRKSLTVKFLATATFAKSNISKSNP
jgi:hypothetical protein